MHASIDTFAKKLHIRGDVKELFLLKAFLSSYLIFEQLEEEDFNKLIHSNFTNITSIPKDGAIQKEFRNKMKVRLDTRYDAFFATLLDVHKKELDDKINIISWNYDSQLEIAYSDFIGKPFYAAREALNIFPNKSSDIENDDLEGSRIVKLNGTAGLYYNDEFEGSKEKLIDQYSEEGDRIELLKKIFSFCEGIIKPSPAPFYKGYFPFVNFAWEADETGYQRKAIEVAKNIIVDTDILVVISYSFPNFNRDIDRKLLLNNDFDKVYIQAPKNDSEDYKQRLLGILNQDFPENDIKLNSDLRQFLIPYELA